VSFDLYASSGDLELGNNGDLLLVRDSDKLVQDVLKLLNTTTGSDPLNPMYGSILTSASLGQIMDPLVLATRAQMVIAEALDNLISIQQYQRSIQFMSEAESIVDFDTPIVEQDASDSRQYNIYVSAISKELVPLTIQIEVRL